jgi:hypothetical protein
LTEKIKLSIDGMAKAKQAATEFKNSLVNYFKDMDVEVKDWNFNVENASGGIILDASIKMQLKPKSKTK